jgi:uncharacterized protein YecT (DUF1311 family)
MLWNGSNCTFMRGGEQVQVDINNATQKENCKCSQCGDSKGIETQADMNEKAAKMYTAAKYRMLKAYDDVKRVLPGEEYSIFTSAHIYWNQSVDKEAESIYIRYEGGSILPLQIDMHYARRYEERAKEYEKILGGNIFEKNT